MRFFRIVPPAAVALALALGFASLSLAGPLRAAKPGAAKAKDLATIEREAFTITIKDAKAKAGTEALVLVTVKAKGKFHLNQEYPHKLTVEEVPAGLKLEKMELRKADAALDEHTLSFKMVATPEKPGKYSLTAVLKTSVCDDKQCILRSEKIALQVVGK